MKLTEITKDKFVSKLKDPRKEAIRDQISFYNQELSDVGWNADHEENIFGKYPEVWELTAFTASNDPEINTHVARAMMHQFFIKNLEDEHGLTFTFEDEDHQSITWHVYLDDYA